MRNELSVKINNLPGSRIAPYSGRALFDSEGAKPS